MHTDGNEQLSVMRYAPGQCFPTATIIIFSLHVYIFKVINAGRLTEHPCTTLTITGIERFVFQMGISWPLGHMTITFTFML